MSLSALVIDDDENVREFLASALEAYQYTVAQAADGETGVSIVPSWKPDVVLLDVEMSGLSGVDALDRIMAYDASAAVVMITSANDVETVRRCLRGGAYDYLIKPLELPTILETIERAIERRMLQLEVESYRRDLEGLVYSRTRELEDAIDRIEGTYNGTILALGSALETRDVETQEHSMRVARYTIAFMERLGVTDDETLTDIKRGAFLHDIGKIGVSDSILRKPGPLTADEWALMKEHPLIGVRMLAGIDFLAGALPIVRSHHERWDGAGYPDGLGGPSIPLEARAFAVADALDAITSDRPYREGRPLIDARRIIASASGTQFDPDAVAALRDTPDGELELIRFEATHPYRLEIQSNSLRGNQRMRMTAGTQGE